VRDAQVRVRLGVPTHARGNRRRSEKKKARGFQQKKPRKTQNKRAIERKSTCFYQSSPHREEKLKIVSQKLLLFETKDLSLRLNKHNFPFSRRTAASI